MYQADLFKRVAQSTMPYLGGGVYSSAYDCGDGRVIKIARANDGTRNWLEFCYNRRLAGVATSLEPEVWSIVDLLTVDEEHRLDPVTGTYGWDEVQKPGYLAVLTKYKPQPSRGKAWGDRWSNRSLSEMPEYHEVQAAYREYLGQIRGHEVPEWDVFNDLHSGNVMLAKGNRPVITDPSSGDYYRPVAAEFELEP